MINKQIFEFPITYTNDFAGVALGWGAHETVANECHNAGIKKALIVSTGLKGTGIIDGIKQILVSNGVAAEVFDKVSSNPRDHEVEAGMEVFKAAECDGVVSVGGGSSHDAGKGIRALMANPDQYICDMVACIDPPWMDMVGKYNPVTIPQISVNTTAGTGAESTFCAAIINTKIKAKHLVILPGLAPKIALIDPYLIRMMPQDLAAWTGFDALTHAFESYVSRPSTPFNQAVMIKVVKMVAENLREFSRNRMKAGPCEQMAWAASMAGIGLNFGGGVGLVHGLGHGISVLSDAHHGLANASVALPTERYNQSACPEKFADMAEAMGADIKGLTKAKASDKWFEEIERMLDDLDIETGNLGKRFGLKKADATHIVKYQYANDFAREGNPKDFVFDECVKVLEDMI